MLLTWVVLGSTASPHGCGAALDSPPPHPLTPHNLHPQETVQILQAKVNILDAAVLDQVEARLQVGRTGGGWGARGWRRQ